MDSINGSVEKKLTTRSVSSNERGSGEQPVGGVGLVVFEARFQYATQACLELSILSQSPQY